MLTVFGDVVDDKTVTVIHVLYQYFIFIIIQFPINACRIKKVTNTLEKGIWIWVQGTSSANRLVK